MPELHKHGLELVVDLLDAADHLEAMPPEDVRRLLRDTADTLADLLKRDIAPPCAEIPNVAIQTKQIDRRRRIRPERRR